MNKKLLMAFVLAGGMALAQTSGGSAGSTSSPDQSQNPQATQPSSPNQQQPTSPSDQSNPNNQSTATSSTGQETVVRGCLKQSGGNWIVSQNGQDITLNGDSSMLKPLDGHQVEVHGTQSSGGSLQVTSINMISDSCTGGSQAAAGTSASPSSPAS